MKTADSYQNCCEIWDNSRKRKLCNNTYLVREESYFGIKLHSTVVVKHYDIGKIELNTGGWYTVTTKERINRFSPARIGSERGIWYVYANDKRWEFEDGIIVNQKGVPINREPDPQDNKKKRILDKMVNEYVKDYIQNLMDKKEITKPTNGDCWGCCMRPENEEKYDPRIQPMGFDHFISHFEEKYYVPSIAFQAISRRGNPGFIYSLTQSQLEKGEWPELLEQDMRYMFRTIKLNLLKEM